ncbi:MAG TPA: peptidylprolyl isomerase [Vicinamibacterales bacterium]|nr:peptidylprolyl isomerase [Vicinamibacterales bacterium]
MTRVLVAAAFVISTSAVASVQTPPQAPPPPAEVTVAIETALGTITIAVDLAHAPITAGNFLKYVDAGIYDGGRFYRVTRPDNYPGTPPNRPQMNIIQGGIDPSTSAQRLPPIPLERTSVTGLKHVAGTVSMARGTPDSATTEFFILLDDQPSLDFGGKRFDDEQGAAAFGRVLSGLDVVKKIQQQGPLQERNVQYLVTAVEITRMTRVKSRFGSLR